MTNFHNQLVNLLKIIVKVNLISFLFVYFLLAIVIVCVGNQTKCDRLEANYVICQQYKTSLDLILMESWVTRSLRSSLKFNQPKISYRLTGIFIANDNLYLQTDKEPVFYINKNSGWSKSYHINGIQSFINGQGEAKMRLHLENLPKTFLLYLISCLIPAIFIVIVIYCLDK